MIDPNQAIPVTLNAMQWNVVLAQLDEGPHKVMRGLIDSIRDQCMAHDPERALTGGNQGGLTPLRAVPDLAGE